MSAPLIPAFGKVFFFFFPFFADVKLFLNFLTDECLPRPHAAPVALSCGTLVLLHMIGDQGKVKLLCGKECRWRKKPSFMFRPASFIMCLIRFQDQL